MAGVTGRRRDPLSGADGLPGLASAGLALGRALGLTPIDLPAELAVLRGTGGVTLETTAFAAGAGLERLVVARLASEAQAQAVTLIGLPGRGSLLPVLGIDLVALRGRLSLVALDLAPTDEALWEARCAAPLRALGEAAGRHLVARRWPEFAVGVFSPLAILAGVGADAEAGTAAALDAAHGLLRSYAGLIEAAREERPEPQRAAAAYQRGLRWRAAERENRREHAALARLFGALAARYAEEVLFPLPSTEPEAPWGC